MPRCVQRDNKERLKNFSCNPDYCPRFEDGLTYVEKVDKCSYIRWDKKWLKL
jgi:hypothetical protein